MPFSKNPYQAYTEGSVCNDDNPVHLVVALYQGALDATRQAEHALRKGDIAARGRAINKAGAILTELLVTLDRERGGEISRNLQRLYVYMQGQLWAAHTRKDVKPLEEVARLLETLLDGWRGAERALAAEQPAAEQPAASVPAASVPAARAATAFAPVAASGSFYGGYWEEFGAGRPSTAYSF